MSGLSEAEREEFLRLAVMAPATYFRNDPVGWAETVLGVPEWTLRWSVLPEYGKHAWDGTPDPIAAMMDAVARGDRKVAVESATGTGKTYGAAILALWFIACHPDALVITSAPKEDQLTALLWKEIGKHWGKFRQFYPHASTVKLRVRMVEAEAEQERWGIIGWACGTSRDEDSASRARGFHAEHMLIITEETTGIDTSIMKSFAATCTATHNIRLALGNPDHQQDTLHQFATQGGTTFIRASAYDHPNLVVNKEVIPGACSWASIADFKFEFGDGTAMFNSKARGLCPDQSVDALIRSEWVERAFANYEKGKFIPGPPAFGVDVAQSDTGRDKAAIAYGTGNALHEIRAFPCDNADTLGEEVVLEAKARGARPEHVGIDAIGVGSSAVNAAKRLGFPVTAIQSGGRDQYSKDAKIDLRDGEKAIVDVVECLNLRARMWWQLRLDLMHDRLAIKRNDRLKMDLLAVEWERKGGKVVVKSKDLIREDLGRSTDEGDACVYWNWVRPRTKALLPEEEYSAFSAEALKDAVMQQTFGNRFGRRRTITIDEGGY